MCGFEATRAIGGSDWPTSTRVNRAIDTNLQSAREFILRRTNCAQLQVPRGATPARPSPADRRRCRRRRSVRAAGPAPLTARLSHAKLTDTRMAPNGFSFAHKHTHSHKPFTSAVVPSWPTEPTHIRSRTLFVWCLQRVAQLQNSTSLNTDPVILIIIFIIITTKKPRHHHHLLHHHRRY